MVLEEKEAVKAGTELGSADTQLKAEGDQPEQQAAVVTTVQLVVGWAYGPLTGRI